MASQRIFSERDYYFPIGVFVEGVLHGFYTAMFMTAVWIWRMRRLKSRSLPFAAMVSSAIMILMWALSSAHFGISIQRLLRVYILELGVGSLPVHLGVRDVLRWDNQVHMSLIGAVIGLGDMLIVYRTYTVWDNNIWVVIVPILIDVANLVLTTMAIYGLSHPHRVPPEMAFAWYRPGFPLAFLQNILTTGLLWYKIWAQHRESTASGALDGGRGIVGLGYLAQTLIETAVIYPIHLLTIITLDYLRHPAASMVATFISPSIGIIFVLLTVRVHFASGTHLNNERSHVTDHFPNWLVQSLSDDNPQHVRSTSATSAPPANRLLPD